MVEMPTKIPELVPCAVCRGLGGNSCHGCDATGKQYRVWAYGRWWYFAGTADGLSDALGVEI